MVYIIVLNWNGAADTIACAESVLALEGTPFRLVICDNASADDSTSRVLDWAAGRAADGAQQRVLVELPNDRAAWQHTDFPEGAIVLIQTGANLGYAGGNNVGIRYALQQGDAEYFWVLNNDTTVSPHALTALVAKARSDPSFGIIGSTLLYHYRPEHVQVLGGCGFSSWTTRIAPVGWGKTAAEAAAVSESEVERQLDYVTGASMMVSKAFIDDVGLMQEDYFLYFEEIDWAERGRRSKAHSWKLGFARDSVVLHKVGASAGTGESTSSTRFFYASKIRFMKRFYRSRLPLTVLIVLAQAVKSLLNGGPRHALAILSVLARSRQII
jgi:GT2 family glycosyltransferase